MKSDLFLSVSFDYASQLCHYLRETAAKKMLLGQYVPDGVYYLLGILTVELEKEYVASEEKNIKESKED